MPFEIKNWKKRENRDSDIESGIAEIKQVVKGTGRNRTSMTENCLYAWHFKVLLPYIKYHPKRLKLREI